jgi:hypothetical protein
VSRKKASTAGDAGRRAADGRDREAAAVLVLERAADAKARGARPLGRLGAATVDHEETPR